MHGRLQQRIPCSAEKRLKKNLRIAIRIDMTVDGGEVRLVVGLT